jgi:uncharacterized membrane protein HdeD (DUF308 family)
MKILQSSIFRAICAITIGILLIKYPDNTVVWITVAIGVLFLLSGIISLIVYLNAKRNVSEYKITDADGKIVAGEAPTFPIVGLGSLIFGAMLAIKPIFFTKALMYVIGGILVLGALNQYLNLVHGRRYGKISFAYWILPTMVLLAGLFLLIKPLETADLTMFFMGWCSLVYGITEIINSLKFYSDKRKFKQAQEIPVAEEIIEEEVATATEVTEEATPAEDLPVIIEES